MALYTNHIIRYRLISYTSKQEAEEKIVDLFTKGITEKTGIPQNQIRLVPAIPEKKALLKWNSLFSAALNNNKKAKGCKFGVGDRVMQIRNNLEMPRWDVTNKLEDLLENPNDLKCIDRMIKGPDAPKAPVGAGFGVYAGSTGTVVSLNEATQTARIYYDNMCVTDYPFETIETDMDYAYGVSMCRLSSTMNQAVILDVWDVDENMMRLNLASMLYYLVRSIDEYLYIVGDVNSIERVRTAVKELTEDSYYCGPKFIEEQQ